MEVAKLPTFRASDMIGAELLTSARIFYLQQTSWLGDYQAKLRFFANYLTGCLFVFWLRLYRPLFRILYISMAYISLIILWSLRKDFHAWCLYGVLHLYCFFDNINKGQLITFQETKVIAPRPHYYQRKIREVIEIFKHPYNVNSASNNLNFVIFYSTHGQPPARAPNAAFQQFFSSSPWNFYNAYTSLPCLYYSITYGYDISIEQHTISPQTELLELEVDYAWQLQSRLQFSQLYLRQAFM